MLANKDKILQLIPQRSPMIMVDGLISSNENTSVSILTITKNNIFCKDGHFYEPGLIENIAQTAALRSGYEALQSGTKPAIGYIGAVKKMKIYNLPTDEDILNTKITIQTQLLNVLIIKGIIIVGDAVIAEGEMNIFLQSNTDES